MKKRYNWTTKLAPLYGLPMYDNDSDLGDLPTELYPRDSYYDKLRKLYQLVNDNQEKYYLSTYLSTIDSPTSERDSVAEQYLKKYDAQ